MLYTWGNTHTVSVNSTWNYSLSSTQVSNEWYLDYFPLSVQENFIFVYIVMVNVFLDLKWLRLKYMLGTNIYNKVDPGI